MNESRAGTVEFAKVTKRFGQVVAVDCVDLQVKAGEFLSLLGPSGCGKTTSLRLLAGFEQPDSGEIRIAGNDVAGVPPYRRNVNTVFQHYALFPHMTVAENVAYGLRQENTERSEVTRRVGEALEMVQMTRMANRRPRQLSGGQQQRVALARALVKRPAVLLLDEPLGALDRKLRQEMQIELKLLQNRVGITFIYVTHDQEEALSMSDRIAVMLDGQIEQLAHPDTIYDLPASAFVAGFIGQQNFFPGTVGGSGLNLRGEEWVVHGSRHTPDAVAGRPGLAAVRPESVVVTATLPRSDVNVVSGRLVGVANMGDSVQHVVLTPGGKEILSRRARHLVERIDVGHEVWCTWGIEQAQIFGDSQGHILLADASSEASG